MNLEKKPSIKVMFFMTSFEKCLISQKLTSVQEFFSRQKLSNPDQISKSQFQYITSKYQHFINYDQYDIIQIFKQLNFGRDFVQIKEFIQIYQEIMSKTLDQPSNNNKLAQKQEEQKLQEEKVKKDELIRLSLKKLQEYMDEQKEPMTLFDVCDENSTGKLNIIQFNNFLLCTGIKQFESVSIQQNVVSQILNYFPTKQISRVEFIRFFKISKNQVLKNSINYKNEPILTTNIKPAQNKNLIIENQNDGFKNKKLFQKEDYIIPKSQQQQNSNDKFKSQQMYFAQKFPKSSVYYRKGQPDTKELQYLEQLQKLLTKETVFKDLSNPSTSKGTYYQARSFLNGQKYKLFSMAQSVLQRQKSRVGVAMKIEPKDVIQGKVGDCYFLSSIASLASIHPELIEDKFLFNQNPANYFVVKLFLNGKWKYITTDDYFPSQNGKNPIFARPHGKEIWVMLLQKCWAKCFKSYQAIQSGQPEQAFIALTGAPTQYFYLSQKGIRIEEVKRKIKQACESRYVLTTQGSDYLNSLSDRQQQNIGLVGNHVYSLLKLIKPNGNTLVKLSNPWGSIIWNGDWSFKSNTWTKQLRNKFNYNKSPQDGSFYMWIQDFLIYFDDFVICKVNPLYAHTSLPMNFNCYKPNYVKILVSISGKYTISLYQEHKRRMKINKPYYVYSAAKIILMKAGYRWKYIDSVQDKYSDVISIEANLQAGIQYIISAKIEWEYWFNHKACITSYGPEKVFFQPINDSIAPIFKEEMMESISNKNIYQIEDCYAKGVIDSYSYSLFSSQKNIGYCFVTNPYLYLPCQPVFPDLRQNFRPLNQLTNCIYTTTGFYLINIAIIL